MAATCKGCGAAIYFVLMQSGKKMPVDARSVQVVVTEFDGLELIDGRSIQAYTPHWATCPKAGSFKGAGEW